MPSDLQITNIRDLTNANSAISIASDGQVTIEQNNPSITLGSNATFPAGHVLQVKEAIYSTQISKSDNSEFDIVTVDITPSSTSNKVLVWGVVMGVERGSTSNARLNVILARDSTDIHDSGANFWTKSTQNLRHGGFTITKLDSPSTTSPITYKLKGSWASNSSPSYVNKDGNSGNSTIIVMEVAG